MAEASGRRRRVLSKAEAATALGADLLALCQDVTADGVLTSDETQAIASWLVEHEAAAAEIPGIRFLLDTVRRISSDGRITPDERRELQRALEVVMPKNLRDRAIEARRAADERSIPVLRCDFMVKWASHHQRQIAGAAEGDDLQLVREPGNPHDGNAITVHRANGDRIGYVPREDAAEIAPLLDAGAYYRARCKKIIGYKYAVPIVLSDVFRPGVVIEDARPPRASDGVVTLRSGAEGEPSALRGLLWIAILVGAIAGLVTLMR